MNNIDRMLQLSGKNPRKELSENLRSDLLKLVKSYDTTLEQIRLNQQLDEGIFTSLKAALSTAATLGKFGVDAVKAKAAKLAANVKEMYKTAKAKAELTNLISGLKKIVEMFDELSSDSPTIIKADAEVKKELDLFYDVFRNSINTLASRMAISEGIINDDSQIKNMMVEMGMISEEPIDLKEATGNDLFNQIKELPEFKEAAKRMKFASSATQLKNGTLSFDTGMHGIGYKGEEDPKTVYLLKIYSDGQVRGELKGKSYYGYPSGHYRLGAPISGKDTIDMYRKALIDIVKRFEKKTARYGKEKSIIANRYKEWQATVDAANAGGDAQLEKD